VLVTDYKNRGGAEGAMLPEKQAIELEKHSRLLDYLVIKNSWGTPSEAPNGYYKLKKDFILSNMFSYNNRNIIVDALVPKAI